MAKIAGGPLLTWMPDVLRSHLPGYSRHDGFGSLPKVTLAGTPSARSVLCSRAASRSSRTVTSIMPFACLVTVQAASWAPAGWTGRQQRGHGHRRSGYHGRCSGQAENPAPGAHRAAAAQDLLDRSVHVHGGERLPHRCHQGVVVHDRVSCWSAEVRSSRSAAMARARWAVHRARRDAEHLGGAGSIQVQEQPQGDDLPLPAGKPQQRRHDLRIDGAVGGLAGGWRSATAPGSGSGTSLRRRRHRETFAFSAVRTTHAVGAGCLLTVPQDAHARAKASATRSCAVSRSPTLTRTMRKQSSFAAR